MIVVCSKCHKEIECVKIGQGDNSGWIYRVVETNSIMRSKVCPDCRKLRSRNRWNTDIVYRSKSKSYEKTHKGFLMRLYRNMESRVRGVQKSKHYLYKDKYLLPREKFYLWAFSSGAFNLLFNNYVHSGYQRKLAPSVDRIDPSRGYELDNMEWVTMSENSRRGSINANEARRNKPTPILYGDSL
jgi:hypothetical protein